MPDISLSGTPYVLAHIHELFPVRTWELVSSNAIEQTIRRVLIDVKQVCAIYVSIDEDAIDVWVVLTDTSRSVRRQIYERELQIGDRLPGLFFNFTTSSADDHPPRSSSGYFQIYP